MLTVLFALQYETTCAFLIHVLQVWAGHIQETQASTTT